ncbi:MAG: peptidoglycan-associated lipoprotein Pal [Gammaproteobacteria bacterium]|nr:MAG: peptidoglycan-associated lipoprotein Pal [Gammaproteobacteria bacterium]
MFKLKLPLLLLMILALAACTAPAPRPDEATAPGAAAEGTPQGSGEGGLTGGESVPLGEEAFGPDFDFVNDPKSPLNDPQSPLAQRIIHFDFDSSKVKDEYLDIIAQHGAFLAAHPQLKMRLEGHADERGSREYNVALGERRARAVAQLIELQGARPDQIEVVSYGEELPIAFGHDEAAWAKNRRVEIVYEAAAK